MDGSSLTLAEWCAKRKISRSMFYKLKEQGLGPRIHHVGTKILISPEADIAWLRERQAEAAA